MKYFTIGEIYRLGLLKSFDGKPYRHKATISRYVNQMKFSLRMTRWGLAKEVSATEIKRFNAR